MLLLGCVQADSTRKKSSTGQASRLANAVVSPAIEFKNEGLVTGTGAKMFTIAGPVIVYGMLASMVWGLIWYLLRPYFG